MKLASGILWHSHTHEIHGFIDDEASLDQFGAYIFGEGAKGTMGTSTVATHVNLWKYRSIHDKYTFNADYWFTDGTLNATELHGQYMTVLRYCESTNFRVHGLCTDAGGANAKLFTMLRDVGTSARTDESWLPEDFVSMVHPYGEGRKFFMWFCTTHVLKAMRNQLYTSKAGGKGKKSFVFESPIDKPADGIVFDVIIEAFKRDNDRDSRLTKLETKSIFIDTTNRFQNT